jgi:Holliday junction resolvase-like predicted endonuclease
MFIAMRIGKLGPFGETLAAERLAANGFTDIEDPNGLRVNYPFGDLLAARDGVRYFIGVKARNERRQGDVDGKEWIAVDAGGCAPPILARGKRPHVS